MNIKDVTLEKLLDPSSIREGGKLIYNFACHGKTHFKINDNLFDKAAEFVINIMNEAYPDGVIPNHSRWGHFKTPDCDRWQDLLNKYPNKSKEEILVMAGDLVIVSVLLDAGAGDKWQYTEEETHKSYRRSEGLAIASLRSFEKGLFSAQSEDPFRVDSKVLEHFTFEQLQNVFQVRTQNPLVGIEERCLLLNQFGHCLEKEKIFHHNNEVRPGNLLLNIIKNSKESIEAKEILRSVLTALDRIWPCRFKTQGICFGDVWEYRPNGPQESEQYLLTFHKLSQWLTYSLIDPIENYGLKVTNLEELTALAEYRNGGFLIDIGLLELRDEEDSERVWTVDSNLILEWRALTVHLIDELANIIRKKLNKDEDSLPLCKILEGGTWKAGRNLAYSLRHNGLPPFNIVRDGTVF